MSVRNHRITVQRLGSGFAAVLLGDYNDDDGLGEYTDVTDTGIGRYETREPAVREAIDWSRSEGIPLEEGLA